MDSSTYRAPGKDLPSRLGEHAGGRSNGKAKFGKAFGLDSGLGDS
jgi:hypothetical protein